jgi:hypothetical protein
MAGLLVVLLLLAVLGFFLIWAVLKAAFRGISKIGSGIAYHGTKAMKGKDFARKHEKTIRQTGAAVGAVGAVVAVGEAVDIGGAEEAISEAGSGAAAGGVIAGGDIIAENGLSDFPSQEGAVVDLDGDGVADGFDVNGDGVVDHNAEGKAITGLEQVEGYTRSDGTEVETYVRTEADGSTANNLRPEA